MTTSASWCRVCICLSKAAHSVRGNRTKSATAASCSSEGDWPRRGSRKNLSAASSDCHHVSNLTARDRNLTSADVDAIYQRSSNLQVHRVDAFHVLGAVFVT